MTDLADFLLARIAEDEEVARDAALTVGWDGFGDQRTRSGQRWVPSYHVVKRVRDAGPADRREVADCGALFGISTANHIARWDPARVLAECEAKRRIVVRCQEMLTAAVPMAVHLAQQTLADMCRPYADRPDCREEWKP